MLWNVDIVNNKKNRTKKYIVCAIFAFFLLSSILGIIYTTTPPTTIDDKDNIKEITDNQEDLPQNEELPNTNQNDEENSSDEKVENTPEEKEEPTKEEENNIQKPNNNQSNNQHSNENNSSSSTPDSSKTEETIITIVNNDTINLNDYNSDIKITKGGEYTLTGTLNYSLYIETNSSVTLNLNGIYIFSKKDAAIININNNSLTINLTEGTINKIADATGIESEYDGCLFSNGNLTIDGKGKLIVYGNQKDGEGIATKNSPITINNGDIDIYAVDDGLNTGGNGGTILINNGNIYIEAGGDGIDSNQNIKINDGVVHVTGGSITYNGGLDADTGITISGGTNIILGTEELQMPTTTEQYVIGFNLNKAIPVGTMLTLMNEENEPIISFQSNDNFKTIIISTPEIKPGRYFLYSGGVHTGTLNKGIYVGGTYTKGNLVYINEENVFVIEEKITLYK